MRVCVRVCGTCVCRVTAGAPRRVWLRKNSRPSRKEKARAGGATVPHVGTALGTSTVETHPTTALQESIVAGEVRAGRVRCVGGGRWDRKSGLARRLRS